MSSKNIRLSRKHILSLFFYLWIISITILTVVSFSGDSRIARQNGFGLRLDYIEHFILYASIPILFFLSGYAYLDRIIKSKSIFILAGYMFSVATEFLQLLVPSRSFNPVDLMLNLTGFTLGLLIAILLSKRHP